MGVLGFLVVFCVAALIDYAINAAVLLVTFLFIALPKNRIIRRERSYHTVVAHRCASKVGYDARDGGFYLYKWEVNGKSFRRLFKLNAYPQPEKVLYYRKNPRGVVDSESKLGVFEYHTELAIVLFPLCVYLAIQWMSIM